MHNNHPKLAASILSADFLTLGNQIQQLEASGVDWLHVDVMDGHFVPNLTMGPLIVEACRRKSQLPIDVHLMVTEPESLLESFAKAGADHLTVHVEACADPSKTIARIKAFRVKAGISLKPETATDRIMPFLGQVDGILVMTVQPGFSGQIFMPETVEKISTLRASLEKLGSSAWLAVDGGINPVTLPDARRAGADVFVSGSAIFTHPGGIQGGVHALRDALN